MRDSITGEPIRKLESLPASWSNIMGHLAAAGILTEANAAQWARTAVTCIKVAEAVYTNGTAGGELITDKLHKFLASATSPADMESFLESLKRGYDSDKLPRQNYQTWQRLAVARSAEIIGKANVEQCLDWQELVLRLLDKELLAKKNAAQIDDFATHRADYLNGPDSG